MRLGKRENGENLLIYARLGRLIGIGKMMVELCSAEMELRVWRYLS